ncbi:2OG-Fe(II) oxygenase [Cupriavidus basilensis]
MSALESLFVALEERGWAVSDNLIDSTLAARLHDESRAAWEAGLFHPARIGRGDETARDAGIRGDSIPVARRCACRHGQARLPGVGGGLSRGLEREILPGFGSARNFTSLTIPWARPTRSTSTSIARPCTGRFRWCCISIRNGTSSDGGELALYAQDGDAAELHRVLPKRARLVVFRSDLVPHEVLPCHRTRWALTGWFRTDPA